MYQLKKTDKPMLLYGIIQISDVDMRDRYPTVTLIMISKTK